MYLLDYSMLSGHFAIISVMVVTQTACDREDNMSNYVSGFIVYILAILTSPNMAANGDSYVLALVSDNDDKIYQYNMTGGGAELMSRTITDTNYRPYSLDYDPVYEKVYWERYKNYNLVKGNLDGGDREVVTDFDSRIVDIVIDWKARLMFLSDDKRHLLKMMTMNNNTISTILNASPYSPSHIALDTEKRLIYWSDMGSNPRIEVVTYEGKGREKLIDTGLRWPSGLTLDARGELLFWCDAHSMKSKISSLNLNTKKVTVIKTGKKYFDLSYFEGHLYVITRNHRSSFFSVSVDGSNETTYSLPKALSEWRRIRVVRYYGECRSGHYGGECSELCGHCVDDTGCIKATGACTDGCEAGWTGIHCKTECQNGTYGSGCNSTCGNCKDAADCGKEAGECLNGCEPGWMGVICNTECRNGTYGLECNSTCGMCKDAADCDKKTGECINGCDPGLMGVMCDTECGSGTYGSECNSTCGKCKEAADCGRKTGECLNGCEPGWMGVLCDTECGNGTYGSGCISTCGKCKDAAVCDKKTGECLNGCEPGWIEVMCDTECGNGTYGSGCISTCVKCKDAAGCGKKTGECLNGCEPGWMGVMCDTECGNGTYGSGCLSTCGKCKDAADCDKITGACLKGCEPGWTGELCQPESKSIPWIIGGICGLVCLIVVIAVTIAVLMKRQRKLRYKDGSTAVHENLIFNESSE